MNRIVCTILHSFIFFTLLTSCNYRVYTTASNSDPIIQTPVTAKEKGDLNLDISGGLYTSESVRMYSQLISQSIIYRKTSVAEFLIGGHYALSDKLALGLKYKYGMDSDKLYSSHLVSGSANYFQNYLTKKGKATYGFDLLGSLQFKTAQNFMSVDEVFVNAFYYFMPYPLPGYIFFDYHGDQLSFYEIQQSQFRLVFQPSFSVELKYFAMHLGAAAGLQHQFKYKTVFEKDYIDYIKDTDETNPLVYYQDKRPFVLGSVFWIMGFGPEFLRLNYTYHLGWSSDRMEPANGGFMFSMTSNFNIPKKNKKDPMNFELVQ